MVSRAKAAEDRITVPIAGQAGAGAPGNLWGMEPEEWLSAVVDWAMSLGAGYWVATAVVLAYWALSGVLPALKRWRLRRQNRRIEREFEKAAERRWRGSKRDPWTARIRYRKPG
jgi:hypothetical protein